MKGRNCPVCGSKHTSIIKKINMKVPEDYHLPESYNVVECEVCGMVYADTEGTMEDYDWYYSQCNFYGDGSKEDNAMRYPMVKDFLDAYCRKDSAILNIGIGNGRFEIELKSSGYAKIKGMDPSEASVEQLKSAGIEAYKGNIYRNVAERERHKYDCVTFFEVAEHLLEPKKGIENVTMLLKAGGIFIVSVPDYSVLCKETAYPLAHCFNLEHINYFSEMSLDNLMGQFGLVGIAKKRVGEDLIQCYENVGNVMGLKKDTVTADAVKKYVAFQEGKGNQVAGIIEKLKSQQEEIMVWGTGSYAMSLFAETDLLQCNIQGFVDNNKLRQGRKIYGYSIYAPEILYDKNYTVLICSMLNSEDIRLQFEKMRTGNPCIVL